MEVRELDGTIEEFRGVFYLALSNEVVGRINFGVTDQSNLETQKRPRETPKTQKQRQTIHSE